MENEIIDEARRCPTCGVVTYCDNCPICGKKLPRANPTFKKLWNKKDVAGEEDTILQPVGNKDFTDHMANRSSSYERKETLFEKADHIDPKDILGFKKQKTREERSQRDSNQMDTNQKDNRNRNVSIILAIVVIIAVLCIVLGQAAFEDSSSDSNSYHSSEDVYGLIDERSPIKGNHGEIETTDYIYHNSDGESLLSIQNTGDRSFKTDVYLYNGEDRIGYYEEVYMLPHESFDLSIYTDGAADSYEFLNSTFYENNSTKPEFDYVSYNDYGTAHVEVEKELQKEDLEILVNFLYNASLHSERDSIFCLYVSTPRAQKYEVFIDGEQHSAQVYEMDRKDNIKESYTITIA